MTPSADIQFDEHGMPVIFADVPNAGVSQVSTTTRSGNPRHDVHSGKFGGGGKRSNHGPVAPPNTNPVEWQRFLDAVRTAAREFDNPQIGDIQDFIKAHAKNPQAVNPQQFFDAVKEQRIADMVDMLDHQMRQGGPLQRGRRRVRVVAPRGFLKRQLSSSDPQTMAEVAHRLEALGHSADEVDGFLKGKIPEKNHEAFDQHKQQIQASDQWEGVLVELDESYEYASGGIVTEEAIEGHTLDTMNPVELAQLIAGHLKPPVVNLSPVINVEAPRPTSKEVIRDSNGMIVGVREVEDASVD